MAFPTAPQGTWLVYLALGGLFIYFIWLINSEPWLKITVGCTIFFLIAKKIGLA